MTTPSNEQIQLTKEETAWLMRALWSALQAPAWDAGNRKDLQKLGEALISGKSLKDLPDDLLERIFPHLKTVTLHLGAALKTKANEDDTMIPTSIPASPAPTTPSQPGETSATHLSVVPTATTSEKPEAAAEKA